MTASIVLTGLSGSGKTSVGAALSQTLGWDFIDMDTLIEAEAGCTIGELFSSRGEDYFRDLETETLEKLVARLDRADNNQIISTGGGTPVRSRNRKLLKTLGRVVYLTAPVKVLAARLSGDMNRPLLNSNNNQMSNFQDADKQKLLATRLENLLKERQDAYLKADLTVDTSIAEALDIALNICEMLNLKQKIL